MPSDVRYLSVLISTQSRCYTAVADTCALSLYIGVIVESIYAYPSSDISELQVLVLSRDVDSGFHARHNLEVNVCEGVARLGVLVSELMGQGTMRPQTFIQTTKTAMHTRHVSTPQVPLVHFVLGFFYVWIAKLLQEVSELRRVFWWNLDPSQNFADVYGATGERDIVYNESARDVRTGPVITVVQQRNVPS